jgi:DHA1 family multidrug resistance protein-like MFS transporter
VEQWRKNLYLAWLAQILTLTGFGFIMPFIPLFMSELGITDPRSLKLWVGVTAAFPMVGMALAAPFWGMISDRFGRKPMIVRALVSTIFLAVALALARSVEAVFVIRVLQGLFTGTVTAAATLVAAGTPNAHLTRSLGFLSSATFIGHSLGPLAGGVAANLFGFRASFLIAAGVVAMILFHALVNIGMAMGVLPITGIPLMLVSYGGSSLWTAMVGIGLLMNVGIARARGRRSPGWFPGRALRDAKRLTHRRA